MSDLGTPLGRLKKSLDRLTVLLNGDSLGSSRVSVNAGDLAAVLAVVDAAKNMTAAVDVAATPDHNSSGENLKLAAKDSLSRLYLALSALESPQQ